MKKLCFASHNPNKIKEIKAKFGASGLQYEIVGLNDIGCLEEIEETGLTLEENSRIKARFVHQNSGGLSGICLGSALGAYHF